MSEQKLDFTPNEKAIVDADFAQYINTVTTIVRLRGLNPMGVRVADDRSGLIVPKEEVPNVGV